MDDILQTLHDLEGVNGTIVSDGSGQILGFRAYAVYDAELLQQASKCIVRAIDSIKLIQEDWDAITAQFAEGKILIRNLSSGNKTKGRVATLAVIADTRLNVSFAGVAIRVAVSKLKSLLEDGLPAPPAFGALSGTQGASPGPAQVHSPMAAAQSSLSGGGASGMGAGGSGRSDVATSGLSWSGLSGSSSTSGSGVSVLDAAASAFLTTCTKALAKSVGPMAKLFVKEAVRKVSPDRPFSRENANELLAELSKHIKNPSEAAQFRQLANKPL